MRISRDEASNTISTINRIWAAFLDIQNGDGVSAPQPRQTFNAPNGPGLRHVAEPRHAGSFLCGIGFEISDHGQLADYLVQEAFRLFLKREDIGAVRSSWGL